MAERVSFLISLLLVFVPSVLPGRVGVSRTVQRSILQPREQITEDYPFHAPLTEGYDLYWSFTEVDITFEVHVQTSGWVGFGISPNGGMTSADLIIGWIDDNGEAHFEDRHGVGNGYPPIDEHQDWFLLQYNKTEDHTILKFTRKLDLCNEEDLPIEGGTVRVIWSFNNNLPGPDGRPSYHGSDNRGTRSLQLLFHADPSPDLPDDYFTIDLQVNNVSIPAVDTYYYCQLVKLPIVTEKHHIIRFEPIYTPGTERYLHHIVASSCHDDLSDTDEIGHECWVPGMPDAMFNCEVFWFSWAIGEDGVDYPSHTGFPLDPQDHPGSIMLEVHYDNPDLHAGLVDSSGLRLYATPSTREFDTGLLALGTFIFPFWPTGNLALPPHAPNFHLYNHCPQSCLRQGIEEEELTHVQAYAVFLHAHLAATKMQLRHFRDGKELPIIAVDNNFDFNFQRYIFFKEEVTILPTDSLEVVCEYGTMDRHNVTWGGQSSRQEMCQAYLLHYPRLHLAQCMVEPTAEQQLKLIGAITEPLDDYPYYRVVSPKEFANHTHQEIFQLLDWSDPCRRIALENLINRGDVESWHVCTTEGSRYVPQRFTYTIQSDMDAEESVCGWREDIEDEVCEEVLPPGGASCPSGLAIWLLCVGTLFFGLAF